MSGTLDVITAEGMEIHMLPENARCRISGKCPLEMDACPILNFDDYGFYCVPELCDEYDE